MEVIAKLDIKVASFNFSGSIDVIVTDLRIFECDVNVVFSDDLSDVTICLEENPRPNVKFKLHVDAKSESQVKAQLLRAGGTMFSVLGQPVDVGCIYIYLATIPM